MFQLAFELHFFFVARPVDSHHTFLFVVLRQIFVIIGFIDVFKQIIFLEDSLDNTLVIARPCRVR